MFASVFLPIGSRLLHDNPKGYKENSGDDAGDKNSWEENEYPRYPKDMPRNQSVCTACNTPDEDGNFAVC